MVCFCTWLSQLCMVIRCLNGYLCFLQVIVFPKWLRNQFLSARLEKIILYALEGMLCSPLPNSQAQIGYGRCCQLNIYNIYTYRQFSIIFRASCIPTPPLCQESATEKNSYVYDLPGKKEENVHIKRHRVTTTVGSSALPGEMLLARIIEKNIIKLMLD